MAMDTITPDIAQDPTTVSDGQIVTLTNSEVSELSHLGLAHDMQITANSIRRIGISAGHHSRSSRPMLQPMGCGATIDFGGTQLHFNDRSALAAAARG